MRPFLALGSIALGIYLIASDNQNKHPVWLPWVLLFIVPIIVMQA